MSSGKGRPRKPTKLKALEGTLRADRTNPNEPDIPIGFPDKPDWLELDPMSSKLFDQVSRYIVDMNVCTSVDGLALSLLSDQVSQYLRLRELVLKEGDIIEAPNSTGSVITKPHPAISPMNQVFTNITRLMREYGLTASSRSNLNAQPNAKPVNSFEDFLQATH